MPKWQRHYITTHLIWGFVSYQFVPLSKFLATLMVGVTNKKPFGIHPKKLIHLNLISSRRWMFRMNIIGWDKLLKNMDECFTKASTNWCDGLRGFWALENSKQRASELRASKVMLLTLHVPFSIQPIQGDATHVSKQNSSNKFYSRIAQNFV